MYSDKTFKSQLDPHYAAVTKYFGEEYLDRAGFFVDDNVEDFSVVEQFSQQSFRVMYGDWEKAIHNITSKCGTRMPAILVSTGCFNPVHNGHIHMMEAAKRAIEEKGWYVAGGFLSPSHDNYASTKPHSLPAAERVALASLATDSSDWLSVDSWECMGVPYSVNFTDVIEHFQSIVKNPGFSTGWSKNEVDIFYVFGSDNAAFLYSFVEDGYAVCVDRTENCISQEILDHVATRNLTVLDRLFISHEVLESSSTDVWGGDHSQLDAAVKTKYVQLTTPVQLELDVTLPVHQYAKDDTVFLRDDSIRSCARYDKKNPYFAVSGIAQALEKYSRKPVSVEIGTPEVQRKYLAELLTKMPADVKCINLDPWTRLPGVYNLDYSRMFNCGGNQIKSKSHVRRPRNPLASLITGFDALPPPGKYLLVDDDIATGGTIDFAKWVLSPDRQVVYVESLTKIKYYDYVDVRDFIIGATHGGLVVSLHGNKVRAPYLWPFVNVSTRANIDINKCKQFSAEILKINIEFFADSNYRVRDADYSFIRFAELLGVSVDILLVDLCKDWLKIIERSM